MAIEEASDVPGGSDAEGARLGSLFTQVRSILTPKRGTPISDRESIRVLLPRDVLREGVIGRRDPADPRAAVPKDEERLNVGDIILTAAFHTNDAPRAAQVTSADLPAVAGSHLLALRPLTPLAPQHARWILAFLCSPALRPLASGTNSLLSVRWRLLQDLRVPPLDEALIAALDDLALARNRMSEWRDEATGLLQSAFSGEDFGQARDHLINSGQTLRLRVDAAAQLDDFSHTVRTRFPYPIALSWREIEVKRSAGDLRDAYEAVVDSAEIVLAYGALLVAALARAEGIELKSVQAIRDKLAGGRAGPGFGEWAAVLEEIVGRRHRRGLPADHPLHDFGAFLADPDTAGARKRLSDRRNDQAHKRRPDHIELPGALESALADLTTLLEQGRFLADLRLAHVTDVRWDALRASADVDYRSLMGDHPVVPTETMPHGSNALETDSMYIIDREHRLHLLRPFLIHRPCPICRIWSIFHIDKAPREGAILKSLDHGHSMCDPTVTPSLVLVGLLPDSDL